MKLSAENIKDLSDIAVKAGLAAGTLVQSYVDRCVAVQHKNSGTHRASQVVTEVDFKSQALILEYIQPTCKHYDLGILCEEEEDDSSRLHKDYFWCIDPLDGTLQFIESKPGYAVSIALVSREGIAIIGVIVDPVNQVLYHAIKDMGAFRNQKKWSKSFESKQPITQIDQGGAVMNACKVLEQAPAYFLKEPKVQEGGGSLWDYAATACLFNELNAWVSDAYGNAITLNQKDSLFMNKKGILYASHHSIAEQYLRLD